MDHKAILECQSLWEEGKVSLSQMTARLSQAGVYACYVDPLNQRVLYEDANGQEMDLPVAFNDRLLSELVLWGKCDSAGRHIMLNCEE